MQPRRQPLGVLQGPEQPVHQIQHVRSQVEEETAPTDFCIEPPVGGVCAGAGGGGSRPRAAESHLRDGAELYVTVDVIRDPHKGHLNPFETASHITNLPLLQQAAHGLEFRQVATVISNEERHFSLSERVDHLPALGRRPRHGLLHQHGLPLGAAHQRVLPVRLGRRGCVGRRSGRHVRDDRERFKWLERI